VRLFLYGTLLDPDLLARFAGRALELTPAVLSGWRRVYLRFTPYPTLRPARDHVVGAAVGVDSATLRRLSAYEGSRYRLTPVTIAVNGDALAAHAWIADAATARPWP
jgi:gamma-glutamylcyclotransferase (GGCT)/AIG2-like uncharacterized protein YtfP